jgi:CRP/FNR family transcriptional regulator, polysaccharide utilization system transcription regulator
MIRDNHKRIETVGALPRVVQPSSERTIRGGESIFQEGDVIQGVYQLVRGQVLLMKRGSDGEEYPTGVAIEGDLLGMPEIMQSDFYQASAVAEQETVAVFIPKEEFMQLIRSDPGLVVQTMKRVCQRISDLEARAGTTFH